MDWFDNLGGALGLSRKKTLTDKVQDAAENVVGTVQDLYESAVDTVTPVLTRPGLTRPGRFASRASDAAAGTMGVVTPMVARSGKVAGRAWERTADTTAPVLEAVEEAAETAAATGAAAAGAVGGFFAGLFRMLWWLVTFAFKAAILAGVAYAGWQWLQSRNSGSGSYGDYGGGSSYSGGTSGSSGTQSYNSTYGSVSAAPASTSTH